MDTGVTHDVNKSGNDGASFSLTGAPWIRVLPLRTPTLPPATRTNCYIIGDAASAVVIDPATPYADEQARLDAWLEELCIRVTAIVLTHHHVDHVADATRLAAKLGGVPVAAHAETAARVRGRVAVTRTLDDGARLDYGPRGLRAVFTPGHAPGHLCFVDEAAGAIVAGDMVASIGTIIVEPEDGGDMRIYLESLRRLRREVDAGAATLLPAHGPPITAAARGSTSTSRTGSSAKAASPPRWATRPRTSRRWCPPPIRTSRPPSTRSRRAPSWPTCTSWSTKVARAVTRTAGGADLERGAARRRRRRNDGEDARLMHAALRRAQANSRSRCRRSRSRVSSSTPRACCFRARA
jgi:glyoxylase-like metal-dependent hydrolase (beta-lactamase superfamily II)